MVAGRHAAAHEQAAPVEEEQVGGVAVAVRPDRARGRRLTAEQGGQLVAGHDHGGRAAMGGGQQPERSLHRPSLGRHDQHVMRLVGAARQLDPVEPDALGRERHVPLEIEADHRADVAAGRARQLDRLDHGQPPIEAHTDVAAREAARLQLRREGGRRVLRVLDDEVLDLVAAGQADHGEPAIVQEEADAPGHHDAAPGRQETTVRSSTRPGRPRRTTATIRLRAMPPTRPSASIRNVPLPTVKPRPAKRPGTIG